MRENNSRGFAKISKIEIFPSERILQSRTVRRSVHGEILEKQTRLEGRKRVRRHRPEDGELERADATRDAAGGAAVRKEKRDT